MALEACLESLQIEWGSQPMERVEPFGMRPRSVMHCGYRFARGFGLGQFGKDPSERSFRCSEGFLRTAAMWV